jgi:hypothetical protein
MTSFQRYTASHNFNIVLMGLHFAPIRMVWMMGSIQKRKKFRVFWDVATCNDVEVD